MNKGASQIDDYELPPGIEPTCPQCHYDLRASTNFSGARCPECGAKLPFDKLKFKRDRAAQRRYRKPFRIDDWMPIHWSPLETFVVALVCGFTFFGLLYVLSDAESVKLIAPGAVTAELAVAYFTIPWFRRWQRRRYDREQSEKIIKPKDTTSDQPSENR